MQIVYILGLGHSGSTFLQLTLSKHHKLVGLGEVAKLLSESARGVQAEEMPLCSCGETIENCEFWQDIYHKVEGQNTENAYQEILHYATDKHPDNDFIDASKTLKGFKTHYIKNRDKDLNVKVLFLVRDFRSWLVSVRKTQIRKNRKVRSSVFEAYRWFIHNLKIYFLLKKLGIPFQFVIYENVVFKFEKTLKTIFEFLGYTDHAVGSEFEAHDIYGNRMKNQSHKKTGLYYEHKWMMESFGVIKGFLFSPQFFLMNFFYKKSQIND